MTTGELLKAGRQTLFISEAAAILGVDKRVVQRDCEQEKLPAIKVGKRWLVLLVPFHDIINGHKRDAHA